MPTNRTLDVWKGDTTEFRFRLRTATGPLDLSGSEIVFSIAWEGGSLRKSTDGGGISVPAPVDGEISVVLDAAETLDLPTGQSARYTLRRVIDGSEVTYLYGDLKVGEWIDAAA